MKSQNKAPVVFKLKQLCVYKCPLSLKNKGNMSHMTGRGISTNYTSAATLKPTEIEKSWLFLVCFFRRKENKRICE